MTPAGSCAERFSLRCLRATVVVLLLLVSACGSEPADTVHHNTVRQDPLPQAISRLLLITTGSVHLHVAMNNTTLADVPVGDTTDVRLQLDATLFSGAAQQLTTTYYHVSAAGERRDLTVAEQTVSELADGDEWRFSAQFFRYTDSDDDGVPNVHEVGIQPADIDEDGLANVDDADSDNDGLADGIDPTPWGEATPESSANAPQFTLIRDDGTPVVLRLDQVVGDVDEQQHLTETLGQVALDLPIGWPASARIPDAVRGYTLWTLASDSGGLCPQWRISSDTSALMSNLTSPGLLYFRRANGTVSLLPVDSASVEDLSRFAHPALDGDEAEGFYNDTLRGVLVPEYTAGWLAVWQGSGFSGQRCDIRLTASPQ